MCLITLRRRRCWGSFSTEKQEMTKLTSRNSSPSWNSHVCQPWRWEGISKGQEEPLHSLLLCGSSVHSEISDQAFICGSWSIIRKVKKGFMASDLFPSWEATWSSKLSFATTVSRCSLWLQHGPAGMPSGTRWWAVVSFLHLIFSLPVLTNGWEGLAEKPIFPTELCSELRPRFVF